MWLSYSSTHEALHAEVHLCARRSQICTMRSPAVVSVISSTPGFPKLLRIRTRYFFSASTAIDYRDAGPTALSVIRYSDACSVIKEHLSPRNILSRIAKRLGSRTVRLKRPENKKNPFRLYDFSCSTQITLMSCRIPIGACMILAIHGYYRKVVF